MCATVGVHRKGAGVTWTSTSSIARGNPMGKTVFDHRNPHPLLWTGMLVHGNSPPPFYGHLHLPDKVGVYFPMCLLRGLVFQDADAFRWLMLKPIKNQEMQDKVSYFIPVNSDAERPHVGLVGGSVQDGPRVCCRIPAGLTGLDLRPGQGTTHQLAK